jgi:hypothetical protein
MVQPFAFRSRSDQLSSSLYAERGLIGCAAGLPGSAKPARTTNGNSDSVNTDHGNRVAEKSPLLRSGQFHVGESLLRS